MVDRYRLSFTTGGLFLQEAPVIVERYLALRNWSQTRDQVRNDNLLQVRTAAAALRISKELIARLELLESDELEELVNGNARDRGYLLWVAACRRYEPPWVYRRLHSLRGWSYEQTSTIFT